MRIKSFSHWLKLAAHRRGNAFAVLGYPRSGTTMLSELVGMVTSYYFDRNNVFPASGRFVLHSHWAPARFVPSRSVYIVRDPVAVAQSIITYHAAQGWGAVAGNPLALPIICRMTWREHVASALAGGMAVVDYDALLGRDPATLDRLAGHLGAQTRWLVWGLDLLSEKHRLAPHVTDARIRSHQTQALDAVELPTLQDRLGEEIAMYRRIVAGLAA